MDSRMQNMHAPTVPSGPTSATGSGMLRTDGLTLPELEDRKRDMETELRALGAVLQSQGVDMTTSLLTPDGFPRADLDVAQVRTTRSRIIHLRNDYKELMNVIEKAVHKHFEFLQKNPLPESSGFTRQSTTNGTNGTYAAAALAEASQVLEAPFAKVNSVVEGSPAAQAGLKPQDLIRRFGYVDRRNHEGLKKVAECVQGNEGQIVLVKVSRGLGEDVQELSLNLVPRKDWGGRGLLGCHIVPI